MVANWNWSLVWEYRGESAVASPYSGWPPALVGRESDRVSETSAVATEQGRRGVHGGPVIAHSGWVRLWGGDPQRVSFSVPFLVPHRADERGRLSHGGALRSGVRVPTPFFRRAAW